MFKEFKIKPITRLAHMITDDDYVEKVGEKEFILQSEGGNIHFVAYEQPELGDYVIYLNQDDVYHCNAKVFAERNVLDKDAVNTVTQERVESRIVNKSVKTLDLFGKPMTQVSVMLENGFAIVESTTCVDPANYSEEIGSDICLGKIIDRIWLLEGYLLQEKISQFNK
tara:strand:- start:47 stop:550 length:504 start_codon:yes stop_codon:yes gene_type:complete